MKQKADEAAQKATRQPSKKRILGEVMHTIKTELIEFEKQEEKSGHTQYPGLNESSEVLGIDETPAGHSVA